MQIVIEIDEELYQSLRYQKQYNPRFLSGYEKTILDGTPLPKGHGRLIDADALWKKWVFDAIEKQEIDKAPAIIEADKEIKNEQEKRTNKKDTR